MNILLFANGEAVEKEIIDKVLGDFSGKPLIIAVDGGLKNCINAGLTADYIVGDLDSANISDSGAKIIRLENQNFTDLQKCLDFIENFNPNKVFIFSALGKRFDHSLSNIIMLYHLSANYEFELYDNYGKLKILPAGKHKIKDSLNKTISFFSLNEIENLTLNGFQYDFKAKKLPYFIGISNIIKSGNAYVEFLSGKLISYELNSMNQNV